MVSIRPFRLSGTGSPHVQAAMPGRGPASEKRAFDDFNDEETRAASEALASIGTVHKLHAGETLFVEGETAETCYEVISGLVKKYNTLKDGSCYIAAFAYPGDLVGRTVSGVYQHTVEAVEDTRLMSFPETRLQVLLAETPALSQWFKHTLMCDLERTRRHALALSRLTAMERVAWFLVRLSRAKGPCARPGSPFVIPMSRQDMADHLGLTVETVCRCLTTLKRKRLIVMKSAHGFTIPEEAALLALADHEEARMAGPEYR